MMAPLDHATPATAARPRRGPALLCALALLSAAACNDHAISAGPPLDRFYFPTGLAIRHEPPGCTAGTAGCRTQLLVVSSNFDLGYDVAAGGSLISADVDQALAQAALPGAPSPLPVPVLGAIRIGSFGGELAIADAETCPTWSGTAQALVASRSQMQLYRVDVDAQGGLTCGDDCVVPLPAQFADAYGVTVACGTFPASAGAAPTPQALAFVSYLRAVAAEGWLSRIDLLAKDPAGRRTSPMVDVDMGVAPTGTAAFDAGTATAPAARLYVTGRFSQSSYYTPSPAGYTPLRWLELAAPAVAAVSVNVFSVIRGADLRGIALSSDRTRAYVALRFYDPAVATVYGMISIYDLAGALAVVDLAALSGPVPTLRILQIVPLDRGASEVRVIARPGRRDLVAVTSSDDSSVSLFDDDVGEIARTFTICDPTVEPSAPACDAGSAVMGANPFGLAVEPLASGSARLYVGSFDRGWINLLQIDPTHPEAEPSLWIRIGPERT